MRIIAGEFKSRILKDPKGNRTHPMSEKIRGALFNSLGDITGKTFLDAFAGTGAVAIEALSRGAIDVHAVEMDKKAFQTLQENRDSITDESRLQVHLANVHSWLRNSQKIFDVVLADPPYDAIGMKALDTCAKHVAPGGLLIASLPKAEHIEFDGYKIVDTKWYGNAKLVFYQRGK